MNVKISSFSLVLLLSLSPQLALAEEADPWFGQDKLLHFLASSAITTGTYGVSGLVLDGRIPRALVAAGTSLTIGAGKELIYDRSGRGDPSWRDFTWDVLGTVAGLGVALLIDWTGEGRHTPQAGFQPWSAQISW